MEQKISKVEKIFIKLYPCIYLGEVICKECGNHNVCDMEMGRKVSFEYFESGYKLGIKEK